MRILDLLRARLHALGARLRGLVGPSRARLRAIIAGLGPGRPALAALPAGADPGDLDIDLDDAGPVARVAAPAVAVRPSGAAGTEGAVAREPAAPIHRRRPPTRASLRAPAAPRAVAAPPPLAVAPPVAAPPPETAAPAVATPARDAAPTAPAPLPETAAPETSAPAPAVATPARGRLRLVADARRTPAPIDAAVGAIPVRRFFARISATRAPAAPSPWPATTVERFFTTLVAPRLDLNPTRAACIDAPRSVDEALGDFIWE